jgi:hypothetical protein
MSSAESDIRTPAEQLPITLFDAVVLAARAEDGAISLAIRDICQALAIDFPPSFGASARTPSSPKAWPASASPPPAAHRHRTSWSWSVSPPGC